MKTLAISLATRGRPNQVVDTIRRSVANWTNSNTLMHVQVDSDDIETAAAVERSFGGDKAITVNIKEREDTIAEKWNRILSVPADLYLIAADDDPYGPRGYDDAMLAAAQRFPDGIGMVYGDMANLSFTSCCAATARLCDKLGWFFPTLFPYWFVDHWTDDLMRMIGRISYAPVRTDQSRAGRTQELREPAWWATFFDACYLTRRRQALEIINSNDFAGEPWHKQLLRTQHPLIEQRSRGINENVRANARNLEGYPGLTLNDARYQRVRQSAAARVPILLADPDMPEHERLWFKNILTPPRQVMGLKRAYA